MLQKKLHRIKFPTKTQWKYISIDPRMRIREKWWTTGSCVKIVGEIGKSSCEHEKEQKFKQTPYPLSREHLLCSLKKPTGDDSQRTVCEHDVLQVCMQLYLLLAQGKQKCMRIN